MSSVSNCIIHVAYAPEVRPENITGKVFTGRVPQTFERVLMNEYQNGHADLAGGSVAFEDEVYAAAFNYVRPTEIADWSASLPWSEGDEAVLSISGNDEGMVVVVGESGIHRTQWFT